LGHSGTGVDVVHGVIDRGDNVDGMELEEGRVCGRDMISVVVGVVDIDVDVDIVAVCTKTVIRWLAFPAAQGRGCGGPRMPPRI
jgi:hypothetical protein